MCGRYSFAKLSEDVEKRFKIKVDGNTYVARYNCAPSQKQGIITNINPKTLSYHHWGLLPPWAKDARMAHHLINARRTSLQEKPAFKEALNSKRCLVPADGFYEWKKVGNLKVPHYIRLKSTELFAMAGLWEEWKDEQGNIKNTFTIITTDAKGLMQNIHSRMPLILSQKLEKEWLENSNPNDLQKILSSSGKHEMEAFEVSPKINKAANEGHELIELFKSDKQMSLF